MLDGNLIVDVVRGSVDVVTRIVVGMYMLFVVKDLSINEIQ